MGFKVELAIALSMSHLVLCIRLYSSSWEVIQRSKLLTACDEVFFIDYIHVVARIIIVLVLINTLLILDVKLVSRVYKRLPACRVLLHQTIEEGR
jgi:hypothetical protein